MSDEETSRFDDEAVQKILEGRRAVHPFEWAGLKLGVRILGDDEIDDARIDAQKYIEDRAKKLGKRGVDIVAMDPEILDREIERQQVFRAIVTTQVDSKGERLPFFPSDADVRRADAALIRDLFDIYLEQVDRISPRAELGAEEVKALVEALGKEPNDLVLLRQLGPDTLHSLVRSMAKLLRER